MKKICVSLLVSLLVSSCSFKKADIEQSNEYYIADLSTPTESNKKSSELKKGAEIKKTGKWYRYVRFEDSGKLKATNSVSTPLRSQKSAGSRKQVVSVPLKAIKDDKKPKSNGWVFNTRAKYTIQYTSTPIKDLAVNLKEKLEIELGQPTHLYVVRHNQKPFFVVYSGEYYDYAIASNTAKPRNGWVRKLSMLRKKKCESKHLSEKQKMEMRGHCE